VIDPWNGEKNMRSENRKTRLVLLGILAAFLMGVTGAALAADPAAEPTSFAEALAKAAQEDKVLVVDFYTDY